MNDEQERVGDVLKVRYKNFKEGDFGSYNPSNMHIELNGVELKLCTSLVIRLAYKELPSATITFTLEELDIDTDTLTMLQAVIKQREEEKLVWPPK